MQLLHQAILLYSIKGIRQWIVLGCVNMG